MKNARLDEAQAEVKITGGNINNLRYADDTTLMAESKKQLKSLLMKLKEESEKASLKLNIQKMKIMASSPITSWQIDGDTKEKVADIIFPTKVCLVKAVVSPVVMYECESWTIKKAEYRRVDAFELGCWRRLLRVPWTARRSSPS